MAGARRALVLGDGDGRFTAALLQAVPDLRAHVVEQSAGMLAELWRRAIDAGAAGRLEMTCADATQMLPDDSFDLVCTHFFLDCLTQEQIGPLITRVRHRLPHGIWAVSEFAIPDGSLRRPAIWLIHGLYLAFGGLTGLRTRELPIYSAAMQANGFKLLCCRERLGGILRAELWETAPMGSPSSGSGLGREKALPSIPVRAVAKPQNAASDEL